MATHPTHTQQKRSGKPLPSNGIGSVYYSEPRLPVKVADIECNLQFSFDLSAYQEKPLYVRHYQNSRNSLYQCATLNEMQILDTSLSDVKIIRPQTFGDNRGWFAETFNAKRFLSAGLPAEFVQDNQSLSARGVLRGLHYQLQEPQGKLVRVLRGHIFDVAVDLRRNSSDFGKWAGFHLKSPSEGPLEMLWLPEGFAHGFLVLSPEAEVLYKTTREYFPAGERSIRWDDPTLAIDWPLDGLEPSVSAKDSAAKLFAEAELP